MTSDHTDQEILVAVSTSATIDYRTWDWLPLAATEIESYVTRLLEESGIRPHDVSARAKSIASFQRKQEIKKYNNPVNEITDIVALRIITYSNTDRQRTGDLIRNRFIVKENEDRNPGLEKCERRRGYDCLHIIVTNEKPEAETDWLVSGGKLARYFKEFGGLEIQVRTVAGHAWAEFEHARRYKGAQYNAINSQDQETIDQLFGAAADARRALDETFVAIDRILARPSMEGQNELIDSKTATVESSDEEEKSILDTSVLSALLSSRFPEDKPASTKGIEFGLELVQLCGIYSVEALDAALDAVDSEQVQTLMDASGPVTQVRRLDDELLARFGEEYIHDTGHAGSTTTRSQQLEWRFDRLRGKARYNTYFIHGSDRPEELGTGPHPATRTVRELARLAARKSGIEAVTALEEISCLDDLPKGARAKEVKLNDSESIWVSTNLNRTYSESLMQQILSKAPDLRIHVMRDDVVIAGISEE